MSGESDSGSALVFGGTGAVGAELVRTLSKRGVKTAFTYFSSGERAAALAQESSSLSLSVDLSKPGEVPGLFERLDQKEFKADMLIYAAARGCRVPMSQVSLEEWDALEAVNCKSAWVACQQFVARLKSGASKSPQIIFLNALDRTQTLPLPSAFAATQGKLSAMSMALAKELGPKGICVNLVALGALESGMARELNPEKLDDFKSFSALKRLGQPQEVARSIAWLATENTYMTGRVLAVNGGI